MQIKPQFTEYKNNELLKKNQILDFTYFEKRVDIHRHISGHYLDLINLRYKPWLLTRSRNWDPL